jgi:hypothetical protein
MGPEKEYVVTIFIAIIAVLIITGGYASFSGLAVREDTLTVEMHKTMFKKSDVFDVTVKIKPVMFLAEESLMIYLDDKAVAVVALKKYLDDAGLDYGVDVKNLGENNQEIITLKDPVLVNLADHVSLEYMQPGTMHRVTVEFSMGDASAEGVFSVE